MLRNLAVFVVLLLATLASVGLARSEISWSDSLEAAREEAVRAEAAERPVVLYFTGEACGWCRKMETGTFTDDAVELASQKFGWVKLDVDEAEELAARYRVRGVPTFVVLDAKGKLLANESGYQSAPRFVKFLDEALTNPMPKVDELDSLFNDWAEFKEGADAAGQAASNELVERTVMRLAKADRAQRPELLKLLTGRAEAVRAPLVDLMASDKLATRAAAFEALKQGTKLRHPFDPFSPADVRQKQLATWQATLAQPGS